MPKQAEAKRKVYVSSFVFNIVCWHHVMLVQHTYGVSKEFCYRLPDRNWFKPIDHFWDIPVDSQTTDITHVAVVFIMMSQLKHWKHYEAQLFTYDIIMKNNGKVCDVPSLVCKIKVLNGCVPGTWKWSVISVEANDMRNSIKVRNFNERDLFYTMI